MSSLPELVDEVSEGEEGDPLQRHVEQQVNVRLLVRQVHIIIDQSCGRVCTVINNALSNFCNYCDFAILK
jgi:hypothetical protein